MTHHDPVAEAPIVLVSPAMAIGSGYYRPLVEEFRQRGWEARALGRRGFERDEPRAGRHHDWSYADEIADLAAAVDAARTEAPGRPVVVLGHSLGAQIAAGHDLGHAPADGIVAVGGALPHYRHFPYGGLHLVAMARGVVPITTALFGHLPKPAFGAPGARTLMREWARMVLSGAPPFPVEQPIGTPALIVSLDGDRLAPRNSVDAFARDLFEDDTTTRWHYRDDEVPEGASNDHITWVRSPGPVVDRVVAWWTGTSQAPWSLIERPV